MAISIEDYNAVEHGVNYQIWDSYKALFFDSCISIINWDAESDKNKFWYIVNELKEKLSSLRIDEIRGYKGMTSFLADLYLSNRNFFVRTVDFALENTEQMKQYRRTAPKYSLERYKKLGKVRSWKKSVHKEVFDAMEKADEYFSNKKAQQTTTIILKQKPIKTNSIETKQNESTKKMEQNINSKKIEQNINEVFGYAKQAREKMLKKAKKEETMER